MRSVGNDSVLPDPPRNDETGPSVVVTAAYCQDRVSLKRRCAYCPVPAKIGLESMQYFKENFCAPTPGHKDAHDDAGEGQPAR